MVPFWALLRAVQAFPAVSAVLLDTEMEQHSDMIQLHQHLRQLLNLLLPCQSWHSSQAALAFSLSLLSSCCLCTSV